MNLNPKAGAGVSGGQHLKGPEFLTPITDVSDVSIASLFHEVLNRICSRSRQVSHLPLSKNTAFVTSKVQRSLQKLMKLDPTIIVPPKIQCSEFT